MRIFNKFKFINKKAVDQKTNRSEVQIAQPDATELQPTLLDFYIQYDIIYIDLIMKNSYSQAFFAQMKGEELEGAYAREFHGVVIGGIRDGGLDVLTGDSRVPYVQIKSSFKGLQAFLADSLRFKRFIPVCLGEPGKREEMIEHLLEYGIWIGSDISDREKIKRAVNQVRYLCTA